MRAFNRFFALLFSIVLFCSFFIPCSAAEHVIPSVPVDPSEPVPVFSEPLDPPSGADSDFPSADVRSLVPSGVRAGYYVTSNSALGKITLYFPVEAADVFTYYTVSGGSRFLNMSRSTVYMATTDSRYSNYTFYAPSFDTIYYRVPGDGTIHDLQLNYSSASYNLKMITPVRISYEDSAVFICILAAVCFIFVIVLIRRR